MYNVEKNVRNNYCLCYSLKSFQDKHLDLIDFHALE